MKVMIVAPKNKTLFNFRGDLIKDIIAKGNTVIAICPNKDYLNEVLALGVEFVEIPFTKDNTSILGDLRYFFALKKIMTKIKPDLVFSYTIKPVIYSSIAANIVGVKKIYPMVTGLGRLYSSDELKIKVLRIITGTLYKLAFKGCSKVIFQNNDDMEKFVKLKYIDELKAVKVNGSGVNMKVFEADILPKEPIFLMISRIIREKGIFQFAKAAQMVKKDYPNARFILLGGYENSVGAIKPKDLEPYIRDGSIEFHGEVKDVKPFIEMCQIFVLPTYYCEGLPRTILEAMAMKRPIITTDWPGCNDAVKNGINGFLVKPKNIKDLAEKMIYMIDNSHLLEDMSYNSLRLCKEKYDIDIVNRCMLDIMEIK